MPEYLDGGQLGSGYTWKSCWSCRVEFPSMLHRVNKFFTFNCHFFTRQVHLAQLMLGFRHRLSTCD